MPPTPSPSAPQPAPTPGAPRAALYSLGCRLNHAETAVLHGSLEAAGYAIVPWGAEAEVCVVNSCTVTAQADAKTRQALRAARRRHPGARVVALGCYAQTGGEKLAAAGLADLIVGNGAKMALADLLAEPPAGPGPRLVRPSIPRAPFAQAGFAAPETATRGTLKVQDGCDFMCAFCIIPVARGRARPRALANVVTEAEHLAAAGVRELVLTGVNLGTYADGTASLVEVVDALDAVGGVARIRLSSIEPTTVAEGLLERMADPAHSLVPFLHLPLQSGSAAVLAAMRRRYGPDAYRAFAEGALGRVADLCLGTDVMVGFPGEDDAAFGETFALLEGLPFAYLHVFPYSVRAGTAAARMAGQVPPPVRQRRAAALRALGEAQRRRFHARHLGRTEVVLFEGGAPGAPAAGYTANYVRVQVAAPDPAALRNRLLPVRLVEAGSEAVAGVLA